jgi:hypothetical protein
MSIKFYTNFRTKELLEYSNLEELPNETFRNYIEVEKLDDIGFYSIYNKYQNVDMTLFIKNKLNKNDINDYDIVSPLVDILNLLECEKSYDRSHCYTLYVRKNSKDEGRLELCEDNKEGCFYFEYKILSTRESKKLYINKKILIRLLDFIINDENDEI